MVKEFNLRKIAHIIIYSILIIPMCLSMFYAVPASDDFAFGANTCSDNLIANAFGYSIWNWKYHSGRWLIFIIQKIINPLNLHKHLGHAYGLYMIVLFLLLFILLRYTLKVIFEKIIQTGSKTDTAVLITIAVLFSTYYYSEAYNWYVGATAYALPLMLILLSIAFTIKYIDTNDNKYYVGLLLAGIIPATNEFCDIPLAVLYIYLMLFRGRYMKSAKNKKIKDAIPLAGYIVLGITVVFAPGNFARQSVYGVQSSFVGAFKQSIIDVVARVQDIIVDHPLAVTLMLGMLLLGMATVENEAHRTIHCIILTGVITVGTIFPYLYGRAFTGTYLDNRMQYALDYFLEIGMCIICLNIGRLVAQKTGFKFDSNNRLIISIVLVMFVYVSLLQNYAYLNIVQLDILKSKGLMAQSYELWDGIITEIETSDEEDVVITRESDVEWSPYFLFMGLTDGEKFAVDFDTVYDSKFIMPNVYYGKKSITLHFENNQVEE